MKNIYKNLTALLLSIVLLISTFLPVVAVDGRAATQPTTYSKNYNSGERGVICTTLDGTSAESYYGTAYDYDVLETYSTTVLYNQLQTLMRTTHKYISSYDDCHYKADKTDCENENGKVLLIYTSYSATQSEWNGWNREHVWPKSLGGNNTTGGGADMHHIRPSDAVVNSTRGNKKYGNASGGKSVYGSNPATGYLGGYSSTYFEPLDEVKGDVARICLYVYVRWGSAWGADSITEVFQSVDVLLEWCALDPVDTWEMGRNEVIQGYQGNRNVFIDYPELAWKLFGREVPDDMVTPSGEAMNGEQGGGDIGGGDIGGGDPTCTHANTEIRNTSAPTCTKPGNSGDTYCKDCGAKVKSGNSIPATGHQHTEIRNEKDQTCVTNGYTGDTCCTDCGQTVTKGQTIPATGKHTYGGWELSSDGVTYERTCGSCGAKETLTANTLMAGKTDAEVILILMLMGVSDSLILDGVSK